MLKYFCRIKDVINLNSGFYKDLDTNFESACELVSNTFTHNELVEMLSNGNIPQKQFAALELDCLNNDSEAMILLSNLTGCDGKIREAVALRLNILLHKYPEYQKFFVSDFSANIFADATIDINANICRLVVDSVSKLCQNIDFSSAYFNKILVFIDEAFAQLDKFIYKDKKYVINKQLFKLYWSLEALKLYVLEMDKDKLKLILNRVLLENEYTIREKAAQILSLFNSDDFNELKSKIKADDNYYVRQALKS